MKLNNKGFAITSVLYGLLILFVVLVGTYLTILSAQKNRVDTLVEGIEENYNSETCIYDNPVSDDLCNCVYENVIIEAPYTGKYKIDTPGSGSQEFQLTKGEDICEKVKPYAYYCNFGKITVINVCYKTSDGGYNE